MHPLYYYSVTVFKQHPRANTFQQKCPGKCCLGVRRKECDAADGVWGSERKERRE